MISADKLAYLVQQSLADETLTQVAIASATAALAAALLLTLISDRHHIHSLRPSSLIIVFLGLTSLFDLVRVRTEALREKNSAAIVLGVGDS